MAQQFTPWQKMRAFETQVRKIEDHWKIRDRDRCKVSNLEEEDDVITAVPVESCYTTPFLTYYNNGKCNNCSKTAYDYNYCFCEGYDQKRHRDDRKHKSIYMNIDIEEESPCRTVPLLTNSNYGHRPPLDPMKPKPKNYATTTFYRNRGTWESIKANEYHDLRLNPTTSLKWNAQFGYTYSPPRN